MSLPVKTSKLNGRTVLSFTYQDPGNAMVNRLREKIQARKAERVQLVLPQEAVASEGYVIATPEPAIAVSASQPANPQPAPPAQLPVLTDVNHGVTPAIAPAALTPPMPAQLPGSGNKQ
ncbi:MAG: hypothetical protein L0Y71_06770 [Gemmataceae bacterium]|nr:hypothetical protein [Gemmataceae bacterium]